VSPRRIGPPRIKVHQPRVARSTLADIVKWGVATVALCSAAAGCQSHSGPSTTPGGPAPGSSGSDVGHAAKPLDVCSMLSPQDISALLGTTAPGKPSGKDPQMGGCSWDNASTEESVSVEISNPGTAPNNILPPPEAGVPVQGTPGPDGMRFMGGGMVEFAAGNRSNTVQVAVLRLLGDQANSAAVDLARKIRPQVPE
jgi:hypothetical protein